MAQHAQREAEPRLRMPRNVRVGNNGIWDRMTKGRWILGSLVALILVAITGIGIAREVSSEIGHGPNAFVLASGSLKPGHMTYEYRTFNGLAREQTNAMAGQTITLDYSLHVTKGSLTAEVVDPAGRVLWSIDVPSQEDRSGTATIPATEAGEYEVVLVGLDTGGSFDVLWTSN